MLWFWRFCGFVLPLICTCSVCQETEGCVHIRTGETAAVISSLVMLTLKPV